MKHAILLLLAIVGSARQVVTVPDFKVDGMNAMVAGAKKNDASVFVSIGTILPPSLPTSFAQIETWAEADFEARVGKLRCYGRSSYEYLPREMRSLTETNYMVLHDAHKLIASRLNRIDDMKYSPKGALKTWPEELRKSVATHVFNGHEKLEDGYEALLCNIVVRPGYAFTDKKTGKTGTYCLKPIDGSAGDLSGFPLRDDRLQTARDRELNKLAPLVDSGDIQVLSGIYKAKTLFGLASAGAKGEIRLDARFADNLLLVVNPKSLSKFQLLSALADCLDLYPREAGGTYLMAVSPSDPVSFAHEKAEVESYNNALAILREEYKAGIIPNYVQPSYFLSNKRTLDAHSTSSLMDDLKHRGYLGFPPDVVGAADTSSPDRFAVKPYLSVSIGLGDGVSVTNLATTYP